MWLGCVQFFCNVVVVDIVIDVWEHKSKRFMFVEVFFKGCLLKFDAALEQFDPKFVGTHRVGCAIVGYLCFVSSDFCVDSKSMYEEWSLEKREFQLSSLCFSGEKTQDGGCHFRQSEVNDILGPYSLAWGTATAAGNGTGRTRWAAFGPLLGLRTAVKYCSVEWDATKFATTRASLIGEIVRSIQACWTVQNVRCDGRDQIIPLATTSSSGTQLSRPVLATMILSIYLSIPL